MTTPIDVWTEDLRAAEDEMNAGGYLQSLTPGRSATDSSRGRSHSLYLRADVLGYLRRLVVLEEATSVSHAVNQIVRRIIKAADRE